jgi:hypothetical protein
MDDDDYLLDEAFAEFEAEVAASGDPLDSFLNDALEEFDEEVTAAGRKAGTISALE